MRGAGKYPEWVYDRKRELSPGKLRQVLARLAKLISDVPPEQKEPLWIDITEDGGYYHHNALGLERQAS